MSRFLSIAASLVVAAAVFAAILYVRDPARDRDLALEDALYPALRGDVQVTALSPSGGPDEPGPLELVRLVYDITVGPDHTALDVGRVRAIDLDYRDAGRTGGFTSFDRYAQLPQPLDVRPPSFPRAGLDLVPFRGGVALDWRQQRLLFVGDELRVGDRSFPFEGPELALLFEQGELREVLTRPPSGDWVPYVEP